MIETDKLDGRDLYKHFPFAWPLPIIIMKRTLAIGLPLILWALAVTGQSTETTVFAQMRYCSTFAWM